MKIKEPEQLDGQRSALMDKPDTISRLISIDRKVLDEDSRTVSLSFSSEEPIKDYSWEPPQVLLHSKKAVNLSRIKDVGSILFNHNPDRIVASVLDAWVDTESRKGRAVVKFDKTSDGNLAFERVKAGSLKGVSVAARPIKNQTIGEKEEWNDPEGRSFRGPLIVATQWEVVELSLTPVPADGNVGINRTLEDSKMKLPAEVRELCIKRGLVEEGASDEEILEALEKTEFKRESEPSGTQRTIKQTDDNIIPDELDIAQRYQKAEEAERAGTLAERTRIETLTKIQQKAGMLPETLQGWISQNVNVDVARQEALDFMTIRHRPIGPGGQRIDFILDDRDKFKRSMEHHLIRRARDKMRCSPESMPYEEKYCSDIASDLPLIEVGRRFLIKNGISEANSWNKDGVIRGLQHSTSDFPSLLQNIATKSLGVGYNEAPVTWRIWCGTGNLPDFKTASRVALGDLDAFEVVKELMPITETSMSDKKETYALSTWAKRFGVSRQALINDDLDGFSKTPQKLGAAAARTINQQVYGQFTSPPTMTEDSTSLWSASHTSGSNYTASGTAPSITSLSTGLKLMRKQKGVGGDSYQNISPRYLIVPAELEAAGRQVIEGVFMPTATTSARVGWMSSLVLVVEPLLADSSTTAWFLAASPNEQDTVEVAFLNGNQTPQITTIQGGAILGTEWIAYIDFVAVTLDHRGLYKDSGTGG